MQTQGRINPGRVLIGLGAPLGIGGERLHEWMFAAKSASDSDASETAHFTLPSWGHPSPKQCAPTSASFRGKRTTSPRSTQLVYDIGRPTLSL
jgi:hypothetical protein